MLSTCQFFSSVLATNVTINVVVPTPEGEEQIIEENFVQNYPYQSGFPVIYLLHGAYGNCHSWVRFSSIERYAQKHRCVLVMASAENSFYHNEVYGNRYYDFFADELPQMVGNVFPISTERSKTFVAGFSMGGYGAWLLALKHPERFAKAASLSGALDLAYLHESPQYGVDDGPIPWHRLFKDPQNLRRSNSDLIKLYDDLQASGRAIPALYQSIGLDDPLYELNLKVKEQLTQRQAQLLFYSEPGGHNWEFWDQDIQRVLQWMLPS
ncbi:alpha/beta hydrolase [Celerinatantimonas diazotrophica]|uniref:S-formylglutathione hydrolase FrmB n=1 Tax=Celerinatantimonas diazotrophica TaxID=412034 RepID=A0A4R1J905_9GAMM|nr:alpha/beta hydrolase family protein [Celerinatantimonas diazotrophica]TCK47058.1 S-formylglutathione hydrolase FrmB [Celerinatantimonas diazotrophica]CAG9295826.1 hypothetical protein CEDIAZO_00958 [Celerinatantimonas diazotrophica]